MENKKKSFSLLFENPSREITDFAGSTAAFIVAFGIILLWLVTSPVAYYSDIWQVIINTGITIITILMVYLIQRSQNKDSIAIHLKLNELVASTQGASKRLIDAENFNEDELAVLRKYYDLIVKKDSEESDLKNSHSVEEAHGKNNQCFHKY